MSARARGALDAAAWLLPVVAVLALVGLAALAALEYALLGWLSSDPRDLPFVAIAGASGVLGAAGAVRVAGAARRGGSALRRAWRDPSGRTPPPPAVGAVARELGVLDRLDVVRSPEAFALTHGLLRPRIMVTTELISVLTSGELRAVLAHERSHLRRRDPARVLGARLLAGYAWYLPASGWLAERFALRRELAADRAAAACAGVAALASALVKLAEPPRAFAAAPAVNPRGRLEARISQLEGGKITGRPRLARGYLAATLGNGAVLGASALCCLGLSTALPGGVL